jgi:hypothetical protein
MISAFCAGTCLALLVLALLGNGERGTDDALMATARLSFLLFWLAYSGSALVAVFGPGFRFIKVRARDFGLAFASAHLVHVGLVLWLCYIGAPPDRGAFIFFGIALIWTYLLALLSLDRLHKAIGPTGWWVLSTIGLNYIAYAFAVDFLKSPSRGIAIYIAGYLPFTVLSLAGPALRATAWGLNIYSMAANTVSQSHRS